ncbi:MAG: transposase [Candidatus Goldiibacteriota bacterium]
MTRPTRIQFSGALYHIVLWGNENRKICRSNSDFKAFKEILGCAGEKYKMKIYAYVLMPNHYHLLVMTQKANLAKIMHYINTCYTRYFNRRYRRIGHLFRSRFQSYVLEKQSCLLKYSRYIHLNPVRAGLAAGAHTYNWSGYKEYAGGIPAQICDTKEILGFFADNGDNPAEMYRAYLQKGMQLDHKKEQKEIYSDYVIGSDEFKKMVFKCYGKNNKKHTQAGARIKELDCKKVIRFTAEKFKMPENELRLKKGKWNPGKKIAIYILWKKTDMKANEISKLFGGMHYSNVSKRAKDVEQEYRKNGRIKKIIDAVVRESLSAQKSA